MGSRIYVIQMPATSRHRERFFASPEWQRYRAALERRLRAIGVNPIDASDWARDDEFADTIHLKPSGAARVTARLAKSIEK
jgi:hypothetical protein